MVDHGEHDRGPVAVARQLGHCLMEPLHLLRPEHVVEIRVHGVAAERAEEARHGCILAALPEALLITLLLFQVESVLPEARQAAAGLRRQCDVHGLWLDVKPRLRGHAEQGLLGCASAVKSHVALLPGLVHAEHRIGCLSAHDHGLVVDPSGVEAGHCRNLQGIHLESLDVDQAWSHPVAVFTRDNDGTVLVLTLHGARRNPHAGQRAPSGNHCLARGRLDRIVMRHDVSVGRVRGQGYPVVALEVPLALGRALRLGKVADEVHDRGVEAELVHAVEEGLDLRVVGLLALADHLLAELRGRCQAEEEIDLDALLSVSADHVGQKRR
mmetsp:Transcript_125662/g.341205  ORF Transcript_125662/g.341205 Transcript_125662/m.341205 type:complete len:326 (+) Transcript_125662:1255-2232(+)